MNVIPILNQLKQRLHKLFGGRHLDAVPQIMAKRFLVINDDEFEEKTKRSKNNNTEKCEQRAHKAFVNFLMANGVDENSTDYWNYTEPELDKYLARFWFGARKDICEGDEENYNSEDPDMKDRMYKASSLRNFRYSINRILRSKGHLYDITSKHTTSFIKSQQAFVDAIKELKEEGLGNIKSYPEIEETGTFVSQYFSPLSCVY